MRTPPRPGRTAAAPASSSSHCTRPAGPPAGGRVRHGHALRGLAALVFMLSHATASRLAAQSPAADPFQPGNLSGWAVHAVAPAPDGGMLIGGDFTIASDSPRRGFARFGVGGLLDPAPGAWVNGSVSCLAVQADGRVIIGGWFQSVGGQPRSHLARLNPDGSVDAGFTTDADDRVAAVVLQADGKVLVGGAFTTLGGQPRSRLARLNPDGSLDASFQPAFNDRVMAVIPQPDGRILVGGRFTKVAGQDRNRLVRLGVDGAVDSGWYASAGKPWSTTDQVMTLALQPDGRLVVAGSFSSLNGTTRYRIGRLNPDGQVDASFSPDTIDNWAGQGGVVQAYVSGVTLQTDGGLLVHGYFPSVQVPGNSYLARFTPSGSVDRSFLPAADGDVYAAALQSDGRLLVGGRFQSLGGQNRPLLGRLVAAGMMEDRLIHANGTITWRRTGAGPQIWHATFEHSPDGLQWAALGTPARAADGWRLSGVALPAGAKLRARGWVCSSQSSWFVETPWVPGVPPGIEIQPADVVADAGTSAWFKVLATGTEPLAFRWMHGDQPLADQQDLSGTQSPNLVLSNLVKSAAGDYRVIVSNTFGVVTSKVAVLQVNDPVLTRQPQSVVATPGQGLSLTVAAAGTQPISFQWWRDGTPLPHATHATLDVPTFQEGMAGVYQAVASNASGTITSTVAMVTARTEPGLSPEFAPALNGTVSAIALQRDGKVILGGAFTQAGGQSRQQIARFEPSGAPDAGFDPQADLFVNCITVQPDDRILIGGSFTKVGGQSHPGLARLHPDGSVDAGFTAAVQGSVYSLVLQPDGRILVGGNFITLNGDPCPYLGRLNADGSRDTGFNPCLSGNGFPLVMYPHVASLMVQPDGKILVGGEFSAVGAQYLEGLVRLHPDGTVDTDYQPWVELKGRVQALALRPDGALWVAGGFRSQWGAYDHALVQLAPDGTLREEAGVRIDSGDIRCLAVQADGSVWMGGRFTGLDRYYRGRLGRVLADGRLDLSMELGADDAIYALAQQPDGSLLAGGNFRTLGGEPRWWVGRLRNTAQTLQRLSIDGSGLQWLWSGTGPDLGRVDFEYSADGVVWHGLGAGERTSLPSAAHTEWRSTATTVPNVRHFRALGWEAGCGTGDWIIEARLTLAPPSILTQPVSESRETGRTARFRVAVDGPAPLRYQWQKDGVDLVDDGRLSGSTTAELSIADLRAEDAGDYSVNIYNAYGSVASSAARLTVTTPVPTTTYLLSEYYYPFTPGNEWTYDSSEDGQTWTTRVRVEAANTALTSYTGRDPVQSYTRQAHALSFDQGAGRWTNYLGTGTAWGHLGTQEGPGPAVRFDPGFLFGTPLPLGGQQSITNAVYADGTYVGEGIASVRLLDVQTITVPAGTFPDCLRLEIRTVEGGRTRVEECWWARGTGPVRWTHGDPADPTPETNELRAVLRVVPLRITASPGDTTVPLGGAFHLGIGVIGTGPLTWQWWRDGIPLWDDGRIGGSTSPTLRISDVTLSDAGEYWATVSTPYGSARSGTSRVTVAGAGLLRLLDYARPLSPGQAWIYEGTDWDGTPATTVVGILDGAASIASLTGRAAPVSYTTNVARLYSAYGSFDSGGDFAVTDWWYDYLAGGSSWTMWGSDDDPGTEELRIDGGLALPEWVAGGGIYTATGDLYLNGAFVGVAQLQVEVLAHSGVTVPAGRFPDALQLRFTFSSGGKIQVYEEWWARGVGMVKHRGISGPGAAEQQELARSASLTALQAPTLAIHLNAGAIQIDVRGPPGLRYALDVTGQLPPLTGWTGLATNTVTATPWSFVDPAPPVTGQRHYRARWVP